jgi:general secretion pathway protein D
MKTFASQDRNDLPPSRRRALIASATLAALSTTIVQPVAVRGQAQADVAATTAPATTPPAATSPTTRSNGRPATTRGITDERGGLVLNFQDASIDVVLDELSAAAGFIVVKEVRPEGRVTLVSRRPLSPSDAISLLNTVLRNAGYTAIQQERILKIVARDAAKRLNIPVRTGNDPAQIAATDELITQVIPLRFADATQLKTDLQPLVNPDADFASNASSNALVITDTSANVRRVVEIVKSLDTSMAASIDVKVVQLKYATASTAATLINSVFGSLDTARPTGEGGANPQRAGQPGGGGGDGGGNRDAFRRFIQQQQQQQAGGARSGKITAAADDRTNSVVITGPTDTLESVAKVLSELDANPADDESVFVYRLLNAQAINLESVLNSLFSGSAPPQRTITSNADLLRQARSSRTSDFGGSFGANVSSNNRTQGGGFGGAGGFQSLFGGQQGRLSANAQQTAAQMAGQVYLIADIDTNSLIVRTAPNNFERVKKILQEIDRPVPQVLIKVLVAEVTHDKSTDVGAELSVLNLRGSGNGQSIGTSFGIPTDPAAGGTGLVLQILETDFTAAIRALETTGKLDVLSRPYILASDNQLASITVGQEVPRISNSIISDSGQTTNTVSYEDIGILLDVIPHINPDGLVILDVAPEISSLTGTSVQISETAFQPVIAKRSAQSRVSVRNGQTIVIGGLMEDRVTNTVNKVPLLGDIPVIGEAFRRTQTTKVKTELLIFLTPHVTTDPAKLQDAAREEVEGTQLLPGAVGPGVLEQHMDGLQRGRTAPGPASRPTDWVEPGTRAE